MGSPSLRKSNSGSQLSTTLAESGRLFCRQVLAALRAPLDLVWERDCGIATPIIGIRTATLPLPDEMSSASTLTVTFEAYDRLNKRNLYFKADGKRFDDDRTLKVCCDVKYDLTVTVKPPSVAPLE